MGGLPCTLTTRPTATGEKHRTSVNHLARPRVGMDVRHHENMRCYNHHDQEAVGICRSCGRGLCPRCAAEVEKAVACRDRCESDVATIFKLNRNALQYAKTTKQARYLAPTMIVVLGAVLTTLGVTYDGIGLAIFAGGVVMAIGIAFLVIQYRMAKGLKA